MTIYVATAEHDRGVRVISEFLNKDDLRQFAQNYEDGLIPNTASINDILGQMYDTGCGHGPRDHTRISRKEAIRALHDQPWIENGTFLDSQ